MLLLSGLCPHQSVPVEMDESMTSSSLDLAWPPPCRQCQEHPESSKHVDMLRHIPKSTEAFHTDFHPAGVCPRAFHGQVWTCNHNVMASRNRPFQLKDRMIQESLEAPLALRSDVQYPALQLAGQCDWKQKNFKSTSF